MRRQKEFEHQLSRWINRIVRKIAHARCRKHFFVDVELAVRCSGGVALVGLRD